MARVELPGLQTFLAIAEHGSLRAAARMLGVNPPAVSLQLKAFEDRLGTALFTRSTRSVTMTDAGRALFLSTRHLVGAIEDALDTTREVGKARSGQLRITLPYRAWQLIIAPRLAAFEAAHAGVELDLSIDEGLVDIVSRGFHAGIRLGDHLQNEMIARRLTPPQQGAYIASPDYLNRHGKPTKPSDLLSHRCIRHRQISSGRIAEWRFLVDGVEVSVDVTGRLVLNDLRTIVEAAKQGLGIGWSLREGVAEDVRRGDLVEVLPTYSAGRPGFFLYFPKPLARLGLLRAFIDHFGTAGLMSESSSGLPSGLQSRNAQWGADDDA
ncbi:LysR family transcriptional regulator [Mesorhizobium sp. NZP2077]|uniref:LysR family transcriptional regulator n=1 Tax=Mesorhizobium sp. NZP2077 TaxID=2483404 RepID=UPI001554CB44|nr:LysR family transcriptional regulator [Mesorhizobium sp. NZP2077]QKC82945.1 LysR family transcriptional regulator [Mesorhizobium sp. NZP2077]QKD16449.1 LysR family transcriptional regulator [Mesorhizobium sp. NZP2077]